MKIFRDIVNFIKNEYLQNRRTVLLSWLVSYIFILIVPIIIGFASSAYAQRVLKKEIFTSNRLRLEVLKNNADKFFREGNRVSNELFYDERVATVAQAQSITPEIRYLAIEVAKSLKTHMISSSPLVSGCIYFKNTDMILTQGTFVNTRTFFDVYYRNDNITYEEWISHLNSGRNDKYVTKTSYINEISESEVIENIDNIKISGNDDENPVVLITFVDSDTLFKGLISDDEQGQSTIAILNDNRHVLISDGYDYGNEFFSNINFDEKNSVSQFKYNSKAQIASCINSEWNGMKYVYVISSDAFNHQSKRVGYIIICYIILSLIVGAFIISLCLKQNYKPIQNMLSVLKKFEKNDDLYNENNSDKKSDEYNAIKNIIENLMNANKTKESQLELQREKIDEIYLSRAVLGEYADSASMLEYSGIVFEKKCFYIALIEFNEFGVFENDEDSENNIKKYIHYSLSNVINEIITSAECYICKIEDRVVCVLNCDDETIKPKLKKELFAIQENFINYLEINLSISISGTGYNSNELNSLYYDALYALSYKEVIGGSALVDYSQLEENSNSELSYSYTKWQEIKNYIKCGNSDAIEGIIDEITENDSEYINASIQTKIGVACTMLSTINEAAVDMRIMNSDILKKYTEEMKEILNKFSTEQVKKSVMSFSEVVCSYTNRNDEITGSLSVSDSIKQYISEHYSDFNLNVNMIGQGIGMTPSYLSKMFLTQTGVKLLDYINAYRIERAKKLIIENPSERIEAIGEKTGFVVHRTFLRTFKKMEGITPSAYRDKYKNK